MELPANVSIFAVNTMVKHELGACAYRERVRECKEAVEAIKAVKPGVESLRDVDVALFEQAAGRIPAVPRKRARHVVTEDARVEEFMEASRRGDLKRMGELFVASHRSLQHDYEVSCEELDFLVDSAIALPRRLRLAHDRGRIRRLHGELGGAGSRELFPTEDHRDVPAELRNHAHHLPLQSIGWRGRNSVRLTAESRSDAPR